MRPGLIVKALAFAAIGGLIGGSIATTVFMFTIADQAAEQVNISRSLLIDIVGTAGALLTAVLVFFGTTGTEQKSTVFGSARWATAKDTKELRSSTTGLLVGRQIGGGPLYRYDGAAHLLTIAPTRSGKGVGAIIPNLLTADRSIICVDPKGENARVTGRARAKIGQVFYLDPFEVSGRPSAAYNPLGPLQPTSLDLAEDAATLADAIVSDPPGNGGDAHWNEEAKALIAGMILYAVCHEAPTDRTLSTVRDYLTLPPEQFKGLLTLMQQSAEAGGLIARAANRQLGKSDREGAGVLSTAQRHTHFLDSPRIAKVTGRSDFRFGDLKSRKSTVFLILPPERLETYARWLRLVLAQALDEMARTPSMSDQPILFLLDEFAALGRLGPIERAMSLMAGYGMQLWPILQDVHQLRATYGDKAETFFANAGIVQAFAVNDIETANMLSRILGQETVKYRTTNTSSGKSNSLGHNGHSSRSHSTGSSEHLVGRELLKPDEIMRLNDRQELLLLKGKPAVLANKLVYYSDREFTGLFDQR